MEARIFQTENSRDLQIHNKENERTQLEEQTASKTQPNGDVDELNIGIEPAPMRRITSTVPGSIPLESMRTLRMKEQFIVVFKVSTHAAMDSMKLSLPRQAKTEVETPSLEQHPKHKMFVGFGTDLEEMRAQMDDRKSSGFQEKRILSDRATRSHRSDEDPSDTMSSTGDFVRDNLEINEDE
jgi:hypothetical protein